MWSTTPGPGAKPQEISTARMLRAPIPGRRERAPSLGSRGMSGHDLVVRGATVIDGTSAPGFEADVAVDGDRIVIVGEVAASGAEELDGGGLVLAPGWIDTHTHLDASQF